MNSNENVTSRKWSSNTTTCVILLVVYAVLLSSDPVQNWYEQAIICKATNPFSPLNPAIVNGLLGFSHAAAGTVMVVLVVFLNKTFFFDDEWTVRVLWVLVVLAFGALSFLHSVHKYSYGYQKIERHLALSSELDRQQAMKRWFCEQ